MAMPHPVMSRDDGVLPARHGGRYTVRQALREATAACHARVDAAFDGFALNTPDTYRAFLLAHAQALVPLERAVSRHALWPEWQPRRALLLADLAVLGATAPSQPDLDIADPAACWGALYVLEGSRLGGAVLAGRVPAGLPATYLSARHVAGSWGRFGDALERAGDQTDGGVTWRNRAIAGARAAFACFEQAAS